MKALRLVVGLSLGLFLTAGCGGVVDELDTPLSSQEEALAVSFPYDAGTPVPVDAGTPYDAGSPYDAGTADAGTIDAGTNVPFACPGSVDINGQAAAASCCLSGNEAGGDNPLASCVSDWCVVQCQYDCGSDPYCYTFCYSSCRNGLTCTCGGPPAP